MTSSQPNDRQELREAVADCASWLKRSDGKYYLAGTDVDATPNLDAIMQLITRDRDSLIDEMVAALPKFGDMPGSLNADQMDGYRQAMITVERLVQSFKSTGQGGQ